MSEIVKAPEFKRLPPELVEEVLRRTLDCLRRAYGDNLVSVVLYGSFARGDHKELSDFDLLIVCEQLPGTYAEGRNFLYQVQREVEDWNRASGSYSQGFWVELMPVLKTREQAAYHSPLYLDMTEDARILYDKGGFFQGVLEEMRVRMRELGSKRVYLPDGSWYWDLKPNFKWWELIEI